MFAGKKDDEVNITLTDGHIMRRMLADDVDAARSYIFIRSGIKHEWAIPVCELISVTPIRKPYPGEVWTFTHPTRAGRLLKGWTYYPPTEDSLRIRTGSGWDWALSDVTLIERLHGTAE